MANKEQSLSDKFKELETITQKFESGEVDLEEGIQLYRRGLQIAKELKEKLNTFENEIEEIKDEFKDLDGDKSEEELEIEFEEDNGSDLDDDTEGDDSDEEDDDEEDILNYDGL